MSQNIVYLCRINYPKFHVNPPVDQFPDDKYQPAIYENEYRVMMRLTIKSVDMSDFGSYKCVAKNSLGDTDGVIKLYCKYARSSWLSCFVLEPCRRRRVVRFSFPEVALFDAYLSFLLARFRSFVFGRERTNALFGADIGDVLYRLQPLSTR